MKFSKIILFFFLLCSAQIVSAQTGITIGPPRVFYNIGPGQSQIEKVFVTNPSKDFRLELGVSLEDWDYNKFGENQLYAPGTIPNSAAPFVVISEPYFSLGPGETKEMDIQLMVPANYVKNDSVPVKTVMLFVSQLNPRDGVDEQGSNIRIAVRTGIKLYQRVPGSENFDVQIENFKYEVNETGKQLNLFLKNFSNVWTEATINTELLNSETGEKIQLQGTLAYFMPQDDRVERIILPEDLPAGNYIATTIIDYGDAQKIRIAELEFKHEKD